MGSVPIGSNGPFTLPETVTETETDTENKYTEPNGNLCCRLSLCSLNISTQSYATHFFICLGVEKWRHIISLDVILIISLQISRPDGKPDNLGLNVLDEPCAKQSDPTVLDLQLRSISKQTNLKAVVSSYTFECI